MPKKKFTVEFSPELDQVIEELAAKEGVPKTQIVRRAVSLLKFVDDERAEGNRFTIADREGQVLREIVT
jgi:predicted transcriptional regulator